MKSVVLLLGSLLVTGRSGFAQATNNLLSVYAPINYAPVADPQRITLVSLKPIVLVLKGYDANGDSLSFNIVTQPSEGILSLFDPASGLVTYTPPSQVFGADSFTFSVTDGIATSGTVTVALVSPVAVPSVIGMTKAEATTAITDAGLMVGIVTTATSVTVPAGSVISEYPTAAALTNPGSAVNLLVSGPANNRSFVATTGNDANNCTESAYCRTLAAALTVTNPGGEIIVVTSGGYGPATITQPVIITASGVDGSITQTTAGQNALSIDTAGDVTITELKLNGGSTGNDGVLVKAVGFLRLFNVQIQNFANNGIEFTASGNLALYDSKINDSGHDGLLLQNPASQVYAHNTAFDDNAFAGADSVAGEMTAADGSAHYNQYGFYADGGTVTLFADRVVFNTYGLASTGTGKLSFTDCLISENTTAWSVGVGSTIAGSDPGTSLITAGQATFGILSAPIVIQ